MLLSTEVILLLLSTCSTVSPSLRDPRDRRDLRGPRDLRDLLAFVWTVLGCADLVGFEHCRFAPPVFPRLIVTTRQNSMGVQLPAPGLRQRTTTAYRVGMYVPGVPQYSTFGSWPVGLRWMMCVAAQLSVRTCTK